MKPLAIVYSPRYLEHKTGTHIENPNRLSQALRALEALGLRSSQDIGWVDPGSTEASELLKIHSRDYVEDVRAFCALGGGFYDGDTVMSKETYDVALTAVGGVLKACALVESGEFQRAFALVRPPGHHAGVEGRAMGASTSGFCVFNNVAVAAECVLGKGFAKRVLIFDFDVHHGNGTQEIFNRNPHVLFISLHEGGIYPGTGWLNYIGDGEGRGFKVNLPLPHSTDGPAYLHVFNEVALPIIQEFKPDFFLLSAGFDGHHSDSISTLKLSAETYRMLTLQIIEAAHSHAAGRIVACLEGGYSTATLSTAVPTVIASLAGVSSLGVKDEPPATWESRFQCDELISQAKRTLSQYWRF
ncbi:MAG: histone deacetylase family protein [Candidatus Bathyarchaeia archaeon]